MAWLWPIMPLETYLRQISRQATEALKRDVDQLSRRGADPGLAVQGLGTLGFSRAAPAGRWNCTMRRPLENRQMLSMEVILRVNRDNVTETTARIWEQNAR